MTANMAKLAEIVDEIKHSSGTSYKEWLLTKYGEEPGFKELMHFIYNPLSYTGLSDQKMLNNPSKYSEDIPLSAVIEYFSKNRTGRQEDIAFAWRFINQFTSEAERELAYGMVTKNLKIGVSDKTLNKVYGASFIPMIRCELGTPYADVKHKMSGLYISSRKIDGVRRLLIKENGNCSMYSRSGKPDFGLYDILREAAYLPDNTVYDGELEAIGNFQDNLALRQATNSIANSKGNRTGLTYNIFDMMPLDDFKSGESKIPALFRKRAVDVLFGYDTMEEVPPLPYLDEMKFIKGVPILCVSDNLALHESIFHRLVDEGEEGIMLIAAGSHYRVGKRTNDWVKMKNIMRIALQIVDICEGTGKYEGMMGSILVSYKGQLVGVGSGFTDSDRERFWQYPQTFIGKTVSIVCQGESVNSATGFVSLNCPIYKGIVNVPPSDKLIRLEGE